MRPEAIAARFRPLSQISDDAFRAGSVVVVEALAPGLMTLGSLLLLCRIPAFRRRPRLLFAIVIGGALLNYGALASSLHSWIVDDAGITFTYSKHLAEGNGLVLHTGSPPEEGYSDPLWMLLLAILYAGGLALPTTAKLVGLLLGGVAASIALSLCHRLLERPLPSTRHLLCAVVILGTPFVIWTSSGLETGLEAALLVGMVATGGILPSAACSGALVLVRPEAPLLVGAAWLVYAQRGYARERMRGLLATWPILLIPTCVYAGLLAFRLVYFGDALPNPYYAKAADATFLRLLNVVGGGWTYITDWLGESGAFALVPLFLIVPWPQAPLPAQLATVLALAQFSFAIFSGGDWMSGYRFIAPVLPLLGVASAYVLSALDARHGETRTALACVGLAGLLGIASAKELIAFCAAPTTSLLAVEKIGAAFENVAQRMHIGHPSLAHHDAGGTSFATDLEVIDLGGLGDRTLAKHMADRAFVLRYLLVERRPTFVFGSTRSFAAGKTQFYLAPEFRAAYVALEFADKPYMRADLSVMRRDLVRPAPGIEIVPVPTGGDIAKVVVRPLSGDLQGAWDGLSLQGGTVSRRGVVSAQPDWRESPPPEAGLARSEFAPVPARPSTAK